MLAHSGPEEAFQWLLSLLLRYSVCGICWNELEGLALSIFPHWPALHLLFFYHLYWCGDAWKELLSFMFVPALLWSGIISRTQVTNVSPGVLAWEAFRMFTLIAPQVASEASKVLMVRSWTSVWNAIRLSLEHLHPVSGEPGGTSTAAASVRNRLSPTREGKLWCKVCLHAHRKQ